MALTAVPNARSLDCTFARLRCSSVSSPKISTNARPARMLPELPAALAMVCKRALAAAAARLRVREQDQDAATAGDDVFAQVQIDPSRKPDVEPFLDRLIAEAAL